MSQFPLPNLTVTPSATSAASNSSINLVTRGDSPQGLLEVARFIQAFNYPTVNGGLQVPLGGSSPALTAPAYRTDYTPILLLAGLGVLLWHFSR